MPEALRVVVLMPIPNHHFSSIVESAAAARGWECSYFCFRTVVTEEHRHRTPTGTVTGALAGVRALVAASRAETVISNGAFRPWGLALCLAVRCRRHKQTIVVSEGFKRPTRGRIERAILRRLMNTRDVHCLAVGRGAASDFVAVGLTAWSYQPFGYGEKLPDVPDSSQPPPQADRVRIVMVGSLIERKNHGQLADAIVAAGVQSRVRVTIAGDGPLEEQLREKFVRLLGSENVDISGALGPQDLSAVLSQSDVLVHSASYEGWGVALTHALQFGLPIICSDGTRGGDGYLVAHGTNGYVYRSLQQFAAALADVVADPLHRGRLSRASRDRYKSWSVDALADVLAAAVEARQVGRR